MSKLLAVLGATGQQGGSVVSFVLSDPVLSARYKIRGIARDIAKPAAEELKAKGVELVKGDLDDPASLKTVLAGADTVFIATKTVYDEEAMARELRQGKAAADAAVAAGAKYLVYCTEVHCGIISNGKYPTPAYDAKAEVEAYIRTLPIKAGFYAPGGFMQGLLTMMAPRPVGDSQPGVYAIANLLAGDKPFPWLDATADTGKFVGAILANPEKFSGKILYAASDIYTMNEVAAKVSEATGKKVIYYAMPEEKFRSYLPPVSQAPLVNMLHFVSEYGYYGPDSEKLIKDSIAQVPYKLTSLEDYIAANVKIA